MAKQKISNILPLIYAANAILYFVHGPFGRIKLRCMPFFIYGYVCCASHSSHFALNVVLYDPKLTEEKKEQKRSSWSSIFIMIFSLVWRKKKLCLLLAALHFLHTGRTLKCVLCNFSHFAFIKFSNETLQAFI